MTGLSINKNEMLRYLGWKGQTIGGDLDKAMEDVIKLCRQAARPKDIHRVFPIAPFQDGIVLRGTSLVLPGQSIAEYLRGADKVAVMACTLGSDVDQHIRKLAYTDMTRSTIFDAAATALVETLCDEVSLKIGAEARLSGLFAGPRFSPGYGDLPVTLQPEILSVLNAGKSIGLTVSPSCMMIPTKSVTAFVGLFYRDPGDTHTPCASCSLGESCQFYRSGDALCPKTKK